MKNLGLIFEDKLKIFCKNRFSKNNFKIVFFSFIFLLGLIFTFLIPPFQKADETTHYFRALGLSQGGVICKKEEEMSFFILPYKQLLFSQRVDTNRIAFNYNEKFNYKSMLGLDEELRSLSSDMEFGGFCNLPFLPYLPFAITLLIGEIFGSLLLSFYLSRLVAFLIFFISILWSYQKIEGSKLRWILVVYALIPMVTHQASAIGYDYLQLALVPMIFALNINFLEEKEINVRDIYLFFIFMILFLLAKPGYYLFPLLYFLIPREKISKDLKKYILITGFFFLLCIVFVFVFLKIQSINVENVGIVRNINPTLQLPFLFKPLFVLSLFKNTFITSFDFYLKSFFGMFGWLDYGLTPWLYSIVLVVLGGISVSLSRGEVLIRASWKILLLIAFLLLSMFSLFVALYLTWTEVGHTVILGVQGRYFLVFFPYIMFLSVLLIRRFKENKKLAFSLYILVILYILFEILYAIYKRYYA